MTDKLTVLTPILVEGKYDKILLSSLLNAHILTTDGFGIFRDSEKAALLRRLAKERGLIVLTDPDSGGKVIRSHLRGILPTEGVTHLYVSPVRGKEKRKLHPSKEGILGVEGTEADTLRALFLPFSVEGKGELPSEAPLTKAELYADGLSGGRESAEKRALLCRALSLPPDLSANAMIEAINLLSLASRYREHLAQSKEDS